LGICALRWWRRRRLLRRRRPWCVYRIYMYVYVCEGEMCGVIGGLVGLLRCKRFDNVDNVGWDG
jgi:hypothetical protein